MYGCSTYICVNCTPTSLTCVCIVQVCQCTLPLPSPTLTASLPTVLTASSPCTLTPTLTLYPLLSTFSFLVTASSNFSSRKAQCFFHLSWLAVSALLSYTHTHTGSNHCMLMHTHTYTLPTKFTSFSSFKASLSLSTLDCRAPPFFSKAFFSLSNSETRTSSFSTLATADLHLHSANSIWKKTNSPFQAVEQLATTDGNAWCTIHVHSPITTTRAR